MEAYTIKRVESPKEYFLENPEKFQELVGTVRESFGSPMTEEDIFKHATLPGKLFLGEKDNRIVMMAGFTPMLVGEDQILYVDGIAVSNSCQGRGIFSRVTDMARERELLIGLRTQNPCMYRALSNYCDTTFPQEDELRHPLVKEFAKSLNMEVDEMGVSRGFYGKSLYTPRPPKHPVVDEFFKHKLKIDFSRGDSVVCIGLLDQPTN